MLHSKFFEYSTTDKPKYLVILLHGYGSNGENLINLSHELKYVLPDAHYISPNGIDPWEGGFPDAYQWFSLYSGNDRKGLHEIAVEIKNANKILTNFIDAQLARFNLSDDKLFIVGFSQGAMMSMYQGFSKPKKPAGIIAFSGKLILPEMLGQQTLSKPNICLIHGESDSVVPFSDFLEAKKVLQEREIDHESHAVANLDHSIDIHGIRLAQAFIKKIIS
ncbi:MAG: dienelactone hydrolase family protein [Rickettsiales bacterium]|nr:dienelactone hydrolase family protein [Rickettsiales bacterium]